MNHNFGALMYYFAAVQQTSTAKLPVFFLKFKKRVRGVRVKYLDILQFLIFYFKCSIVLQ